MGNGSWMPRPCRHATTSGETPRSAKGVMESAPNVSLHASRRANRWVVGHQETNPVTEHLVRRTAAGQRARYEGAAGRRTFRRTSAGYRLTREDDGMVSLTPSPAQADLDAALRDLLEAECPTGRVRTALDLAFDADLWTSVDAVVGVCERSFDLVTAALLAETMGRFLAPIPFV